MVLDRRRGVFALGWVHLCSFIQSHRVLPGDHRTRIGSRSPPVPQMAAEGANEDLADAAGSNMVWR
jgi:hypothetical protein